LHRALRTASTRRAAASERLVAAGAAPNAITLGHVAAVLDDLDDLVAHVSFSTGPAALSADELGVESELRTRAEQQDWRLPLDALVEDLGLSPFELETLVLCAAPELDASFELAYAFVVDETQRRKPNAALLAGLTAESLLERVERQAALGPYGALRRYGLVQIDESTGGFSLTSAASGFLLAGDGEATDLFRDPDAVEMAAPILITDVDRHRFDQIVGAIQRGDVSIVGAFSPRPGTRRDIALALSRALERPLRRYPAAGDPVVCASQLGALLWLDVDGDLSEAAIERITTAQVPIVITSSHPIRPARLLEATGYAELEIRPSTFTARTNAWQHALPELERERAESLAARFRFAGSEIRAVAGVARTAARLLTNGETVTPAECVDDACGLVAGGTSLRYATLVTPRRRAEDLILDPQLHGRVLDIAGFYRARTQVSETWGFAERLTSGGGIKALFAGDSGTGKTLAAEIVASELGLPLMKVDLAQVVSKWVGETEKNLAAVFREAEDCQAVLFFDEAEALFGSRAEVRHGTDRYANLEVSFLLQRLDDYAGVAILATNLRDRIDAAFTRRFHIVIGFPRPPEPQRQRMWSRVFPQATPLASDVDLGVLARIDLTGAGITSAAETASLLACRDGSPNVTMRHLVRAIGRQFQREARILSPAELGRYADLLREGT
jgi:hypothetical protein